MFHIILGFKNEDKIYILILIAYYYFRKTEHSADGYTYCEFRMIMSDNFLIPTTWR